MTGHYPDLGSTSDWLCPEGICFSQSLKHYPDLDSDSDILVISVEFLCLFLRQHSAEKTVVGVAQGCQNALVTVAFAGYLEVFASCKLLEKSIKKCYIKKDLK